jgi:WD40 repeat protein
LALCIALKAGQTPGAAPPRTDHYGDPLPQGARFRLGTIRLRHDAAVTSFAWAPDGKVLASAGADHTVRLWHADDGKEIRRFSLASERVLDVAFAPDGRTLASAGDGVHLWDPTTGEHRLRLDSPLSEVCGLAYSGDGKVLAAGSARRVRLYSAAGAVLRDLRGTFSVVLSLAFPGDGKTLLAVTDCGVRCWDLASGQPTRVPAVQGLIAAAVSPDGKVLADASAEGPLGCVCLRHWPAGTERLHLSAPYVLAPALTFSPDGKSLATAGASEAVLWDVATGRELNRLGQLPDGEVVALAFSPGGRLLALGAEDGSITLWDPRARGPGRALLGLGHRVTAVALAADGKTLVAGGRDGTLTVWDTRDGRRLRTLGCLGRAAFRIETGADSTVLAASYLHPSLGLWQLGTGNPRPAPAEGTDVFRWALSPDGSMLAVLGSDDLVRLRSVATGKDLRRLAPAGGGRRARVMRLCWSPEGKLLAGSRSKGSVVLWDTATGRVLHYLQGPNDWPEQLAFSDDGRVLAAACTDNAVRLYETATGGECSRLRPFAVVWALAIAPGGRTLATGAGELLGRSVEPHGAVPFGNPDSAVRLWDVASGRLLRQMPGHQGAVQSLAFTPAGDLLVSAADDDTVLGWEVGEVTGRPHTDKGLSGARLAALWSDLASPDAARGQRAVAELQDAPADAVALLERSLPPVTREWQTHVTTLIADLDHPDFIRRERASRGLQRAASHAVPLLRRALAAGPEPEARRRLRQLLEEADAAAPAPEWLRTIRALQVLEGLGTPKGRQALRKLSEGAPDAALTQEAKAALQRLDRRRPNP